MRQSLKVGDREPSISRQWGTPDIVTDLGPTSELWSYAITPNTNDLAATLFYTSPKEGDQGRFLDLKFANGKLVSWSETTHTMPAKRGSGFGVGLSGATGSGPINRF